jgi:hypothetical protein
VACGTQATATSAWPMRSPNQYKQLLRGDRAAFFQHNGKHAADQALRSARPQLQLLLPQYAYSRGTLFRMTDMSPNPVLQR